MTSDNGSEVSFDRQSSGKYSFRLPRPFLHYVKDWETSDQMSYANSAFMADGDLQKNEDNDIPNGDRTLRSSRSITLPDSDTEGYNRPSERNRTISSSTVEADLSDVDFISNGESPLPPRTNRTNEVNIDPENVEV